MRLWLLTSGDGSDGDEWRLHSIHTTQAGAERAKAVYEAPHTRRDGSQFNYDAQIEEWIAEP